MISKKKILVVGQKDSVFCPPIIKAFETLGYQCVFLNHRTGMAYENSQVRKLIRLLPILKFVKKRAVKKINQDLLTLVAEFKPDILFVSVAENISPETVIQIKNMGIKTVNWFTDFISHWHIIEKLAPVYDYFLSPDSHVLDKIQQELKLKNCFYLPLALNPVFDNPPNYKKEYDISFVGSYNPDVWKMRVPLLASLKDLDLHIWGPTSWKNTSLTNNYEGTASGQKMFDIYARSKIVVDIPWDNFYSEGISVRPFEVTAAGACLFFYNIRKDIDKFFRNGIEYLPFSNQQELRTKIEFYLQNDKEREEIAKNGFTRTTKEHTYVKRMQQLLEILG